MTPPPDPAILERNLGALRTTHPDLAGRLAAIDLSPYSATPARTRDGQLSYRFTPPSGKTQWLGRSSIPRVRASILMEQFDPGQGNVLLPGLGEGTEVETLLHSLAPPRVVFVWEPDPVNIRLVLAIHDLSAALSAGRLVVLQCSTQDLLPTLTDWLVRRPAVQCPSRIMVWPWQSQAEMAQYRTAVEAAWQQSTTAT